MLKINLTTDEVNDYRKRLSRIPQPPGNVAIPFPFDAEPRDEDGTPAREFDAKDHQRGAVQFVIDGKPAGGGIIRNIQKPGAAPWDSMNAEDFNFDRSKFYVWVESSTGVFERSGK